MQYSVFECQLDDKQFQKLKKRLKPHVEPKTNDSIRFYPLHETTVAKIEVIGNDLMKTLGGVLVV